MPWAAYLAALEDHRHGRNLPARFVPGTFLVADVAGEIVGRVLVTCDEDNLGSRSVIERCGAQLESVVDLHDGRGPQRRYWID